jgi:putative endopeptidase
LRHTLASAILRNHYFQSDPMKTIPQVLTLALAVASTLSCSTLSFAEKNNLNASSSLPDKPGVDSVYFDTKAAPCDDFYRYATGHWQDASAIPKDKARWGAFDQIGERNREVMKSILKEAMTPTRYPAGSIKRKMGDFYASGFIAEQMDAKANLSAALKISKDPAYGKSMASAFALLHKQGTPAGFNFAVRQDQKNSSRYIVQLFQGGLGLPEREYYFSTDERSKKQREAYVAHIAKMLTLSGLNTDDAAKGAADIMALETALAEAAMTRVEARDPDAR